MNDPAAQLTRVICALGIARSLAAEHPRMAWLHRIAIAWLERREDELACEVLRASSAAPRYLDRTAN